MTDLPFCRWREGGHDDGLACHSAKFVAPPNPVDAEFCRSCVHVDHAPDPAPHANRARVAVATSYTVEIAEYGRLTSEVLAAYARRHGHQPAIATARIDETRPAAWSKLFFHDTNNPLFPNLGQIFERVAHLPPYHFTESSRSDENCSRGFLFVMKR